MEAAVRPSSTLAPQLRGAAAAQSKKMVVPAVGLGPEGEMLIAVKHLWRQKRADKSKAAVHSFVRLLSSHLSHKHVLTLPYRIRHPLLLLGHDWSNQVHFVLLF